MSPGDTSLYGSYNGSTGMGCCSVTPMASMAGSQQVTSSMWQSHRLFSSTLPPAPDTLSAEQVVGIYQLATKYQALGGELTKQFQNLSWLEAMHCTAVQAMAHETINALCMAHNVASTVKANQPDRDCEKFLCQFWQRPTKPGRIQMMSSSPIS